MTAAQGPITTHVLDTALGKPGVGIAVQLAERDPKGDWREIGRGITNADGRAQGLLAAGHKLQPGTYRLTFELGPYFRALGRSSFFPEAALTFEAADAAAHYHVPLLVSGHGYSTYRGS